MKYKIKKLDKIKKLSDKHLTGNEYFTQGDKPTDMTMLDFWRWHYSEIYVLQDVIAEYIVAKALGFKEAYNVESWTLYDIEYRNTRIEIKETSYYHAWQKEDEVKTTGNSFSIRKTHVDYKDSESELARNNDIYIFCLNTGVTKEESNPLNLENWEFYIIPTSVINEECGNAKNVSLSRVKMMVDKVGYSQIKSVIDEMIDNLKK